MTVASTLLISLIMLFQSSNNISFHLETSTLSDQKVITVKADVYFRYDEGKMIIHYTYPAEMISITNNKGEAMLYDPKSNSVILKRGLNFSTTNDNIYLFLSERYSDLGLQEMGYKLSSKKKDKGYAVSEWIPQNASSKVENADKIILAHENDLPAFMAIYSNSKLIRKVYYSGYALYGNYFLPNRITEIAYLKNDSIIQKKQYSGYTIGTAANSPYFSFSIPSNAKIIKEK
jgi:outer membrane lipoprotein-sorting protein